MGKITKIVIELNGQVVEYNLGPALENFYTKDEIDLLLKISIEQLAALVGGDA